MGASHEWKADDEAGSWQSTINSRFTANSKNLLQMFIEVLAQNRKKNLLLLRYTRTNAKLDACIIMSISRVWKKIEDNEIDSSGLMEPFESGST